MGLTLYIGRGRVILGIQRVELLIESMIGGDPGKAQRTGLTDGAFMAEPPRRIDPLYLSAQKTAGHSIWCR